MNITGDLLIVGSYINSKGGDEGFNIIGELHVGSQDRPAESTFGEGDSYNDNMICYTSGIVDGVNAVRNVTTIAQSNTGSTFPFPSGIGRG